MGKIIQVRGCGGVGKSTCVKGFLENNGMTEIITETIGSIPSDMTVNHDRSYICLGRYDKTSGGCDRYAGRDHVLNAISYVEKKYKPEVLIFEGYILGKTFRLANIINSYAKRKGHEYIAIVLTDDFDEIVKRIYGRNGGKAFNEEGMYSTYLSVLTAYQKIVAAGMRAKLVNVGQYSKESLWKVIAEEI